MSFYYPQAAVQLRVRWEDFGDTKNQSLKEDYILSIQAKKVGVNINDYSAADTFKVDIDYKQFPFDPRCIRACGVVIAMEDRGALENPDGTFREMVISSDNTVFIGFADDESISFDDSSRTVSLEGRDLTSLLIDRKFLKGTVSLQQRIDVVIQGLLNELAETRKIKVDVRVDEVLPVVGSYWSDKGKLSGLKNTKKDETYWDVIQDIVARAGLIAYIELDKLVITKPRSLYDANAVKKFVYGKNLKKLEYKRKLGRRKQFNVAVRSLSLETKQVLQAQIPAEATTAWSRATGIPNIEVKVPDLDKDGKPVAAAELKAAPYMSFRVPNVGNKSQLIKIGQEIYEEIGRQQIEGSFGTKEMRTSWFKDKEETKSETFDLLKLRIGTPVLIEIDQGDLKGVNKFNTKTDREKFLIGRGYDRKVASALADSLSNPRIGGPLYTKTVKFDLDSENGFDCEVEFINFIQIGDTKVAR